MDEIDYKALNESGGKETLKRGEIAVNKKRLIEHCKCIRKALKDLDEVMKEKESQERGKKIALIANRINFTLDATEHFELNVPLNKLGK